MSDNFQRYSAFPTSKDAPAQASSYTPARTVGETQRATFTDGVLTQGTDTSARATGTDTSAFAGSAGFEATARNPNGVPVTALLPTTLVTLDGVQAPVSSFVAAGRLARGADGTYREATAAELAQRTAAEVAPADTADILPMEPDSMAAVNAALEPVPQHSFDGLAAVGVGVALGTIDPAVLALKFTEVSGLGGEDAAQRIGFVQAAYQAQADHALTGRGGISADDLPAFYEWARENRRGELQQAIQKQVSQHDVSGYRALAERWQEATPPTIQALASAGFLVRNLGRTDEVFIGGHWMTPGAAAKVGLV